MARNRLTRGALLASSLLLLGGVAFAESANTNGDVAPVLTHYVWKQGNWGRIVAEQGQAPAWVAINSSDFLSLTPQTTQTTHNPHQSLFTAQDNYSRTPRLNNPQVQSIQYKTTLPYSKGTELSAGVSYTKRQPTALDNAQDASFGLRLHNGKFQFASAYLQRDRQREDARASNYNLQVYNVTALYQITPRTRLALGYNRGAVSQDGAEAINLGADGKASYENLMVGASTYFNLGKQEVNFGYFYRRGGDETRLYSSAHDEDNFAGFLLNLNF